jgi:hypothetical protein
MLYTVPDLGVGWAPDGESIIDAIERASRGSARPVAGDWTAISDWARDLAARISTEQPTQHVSVFVPEPSGDGLRLAAQVWGAGEDNGTVAAGEWVIPLDGSVSGRVYRTGLAALCADVTLDPDYRAFPGSRTRSSLTIPVGPPNGVRAVINLEAPWTSAYSIRDYERMTEHAATAFETFPGRSDG